MRYHRNHITRFLAVADVSVAEAEGIKRRTEVAIAQSGSSDGMFSSNKLGEVIGNAELTKKFDELWECSKLER